MLVLRMRRVLGDALPRPIWPEGIGLAPVVEADLAEIHALMRLCYAGGGGTVPDFESWRTATLGDPEFDPQLCFVAENELGKVVGFCLCWTSSFIKDLVVHPDWRRRGIGSALLHSAFQALADRGNPSVDLKVEAGNPSGAELLYQREGFAVVG